MTSPNPFDFLGGDSPTENGSTAVAEPPVTQAVTPNTAEPKPPEKPRATRSASGGAGSRKPVYIDIETIPDESRQHLFGLDPLPTPAVYSDENDGPCPSELLKGTIDDVKAAIAKAVQTNGGKQLPRVILEGCVAMEKAAEKKTRKGVVDLFAGMIAAIDGEAAKIEAAAEAQRKTMSVTPEFCRIVAIGWAVGDGPVESIVAGQDGGTEEKILEKFWSLAASHGPIVGFNVAGFDLPAIFMRSILLGVDATKKIDLKPWGTDVVDLMAVRWPRGGQKPLKEFVAMLGIEVPAEGVDGSQVARLFAEAPKLLGEYVRSDIEITRSLHKRLRGFFC